RQFLPGALSCFNTLCPLTARPGTTHSRCPGRESRKHGRDYFARTRAIGRPASLEPGKQADRHDLYTDAANIQCQWEYLLIRGVLARYRAVLARPYSSCRCNLRRTDDAGPRTSPSPPGESHRTIRQRRLLAAGTGYEAR